MLLNAGLGKMVFINANQISFNAQHMKFSVEEPFGIMPVTAANIHDAANGVSLDQVFPNIGHVSIAITHFISSAQMRIE